MKNVKFKKYRPNHVQKKIKDDLKKMKDDSQVYVAADKTSNFYRMPSKDYREFLENNITKEYKKVDKKVVDKVNKGDQKLAKQIDLENRIYSLCEKQCYVTLKDHKDSFENHKKCRLINPAKTELVRVFYPKLWKRLEKLHILIIGKIRIQS